jgi:hypothetical protein
MANGFASQDLVMTPAPRRNEAVVHVTDSTPQGRGKEPSGELD